MYAAQSQVPPSHNMIVHDSGRGMGGERSSSTGTWAMELTMMPFICSCRNKK